MNEQYQFLEGRILSKEEVAEIEERKEASKRAALQSPGTITRHLRLSIDFHITIAGTPPDDNGISDPDPVDHARQARLLEAVKRTPEALDSWMRMLIAFELQFHHWSDVDGGDTPGEERLAPALATLSSDDQEYFAQKAPCLYFDDLANLFYGSFAVKEDAPRLAEL